MSYTFDNNRNFAHRSEMIDEKAENKIRSQPVEKELYVAIRSAANIWSSPRGQYNQGRQYSYSPRHRTDKHFG